MPFTFAHPAVVLGVPRRLRTNLVVSGLVIGSMAPDFEYFLRGAPIGQYGHALLGFLWVNLPLCFAVYWLFEHAVKQPLVKHLPAPWDRKLSTWGRSRRPLATPLAYALFALSALFGMGTHVFWDNFTHAGGYFVREIPALAGTLSVVGFDLPVYKLLQHGSTLVAALLIACHVSKKIRKSPKRGTSIKPSAKSRFWLLALLLGATFACCYFWLTGTRIAEIPVGNAVILIINSALVGLVLATLRAKATRR